MYLKNLKSPFAIINYPVEYKAYWFVQEAPSFLVMRASRFSRAAVACMVPRYFFALQRLRNKILPTKTADLGFVTSSRAPQKICYHDGTLKVVSKIPTPTLQPEQNP